MARDSKIHPSKAGKATTGTIAQRVLREVAIIVLLTVVVYLLACLFSYNTSDPSWSHAQSGTVKIHNIGGRIGAYIADIVLYLFGYVAYVFPLLLLAVGWALFREDDAEPDSVLRPALRLLGGVLFFFSGSGLGFLSFFGEGLPYDQGYGGGILGQVIGGQLLRGFGDLGAKLFLITLFLVAVTLATGLSWLRLMDAIGRGEVTLQHR